MDINYSSQHIYSSSWSFFVIQGQRGVRGENGTAGYEGEPVSTVLIANQLHFVTLREEK